MFADLLAESRAAAKAGDLSQARRLADRLNAVTDDEILEAQAWIDELRDLAAEDFVDGLDSLPPMTAIEPRTAPPNATPLEPGPRAPSNEGRAAAFRDEKFEAMMSKDPAGPSVGGLRGERAEEQAAEPPASMRDEGAPVRPTSKSRPFFRPEVFVVLGGLGAMALVLKPWQWVGAKPAAFANSSVESQYPDLNFRQSRVEPVTTEAVRMKMGEKPEPPREVPLKPLPVLHAVAGPAVPVLTASPAGVGNHAVVRGGRRQVVLATVPTQVEPTGAAPNALVSQRRGSHFFEAATDESSAGAAKPKSVSPAGLAVNTRIRAVLEIGVTSSKHDAVVIARVIAPVQVGDKVMVPKGALLKGRSSSDNERVYIRFTELLVAGEKFTLDASAVDGDLPGLNAQKRQATLEERQQSRLTQGMLGAVGDVALTVATGVSGTVLQDVGSGAVQETQRAKAVDQSVVLVVPAKTQFEVVVVE